MQKGALVMGRLIDADKFILAIMDASLSSVDEDTINGQNQKIKNFLF